jgi:hypothetical protein
VGLTNFVNIMQNRSNTHGQDLWTAENTYNKQS